MNELVHFRRGALRHGGGARATTRTNDPERTMGNILDVAMAEFAEKGLAGARIDEIAATTQTSKRMIYYYFGSKEGLYLATLEDAYRRVRAIEVELHLEDLAPLEALRQLVEFSFDHHASHESYVRLVMTENMHRGQYLARSKSILPLNEPAIATLSRLVERGLASGVFRPGLDPVDLHASITALTFFNVSNRHTFGQIFQRDFAAPAVASQRRANIVETILRYVRP